MSRRYTSLPDDGTRDDVGISKAVMTIDANEGAAMAETMGEAPYPKNFVNRVRAIAAQTWCRVAPASPVIH